EWPVNYIEIRLADVYLMAAEAYLRGGGGDAQFFLDKVRERVGLPSIPATLDNIYNERRLELATEGHRFFDLVRTGKAPTTLAFKGFVAGKHEILPIPLQELTNTKLKQNPNY
ncbi:MAG: RagB/SusD family nutrient uptake outer membrane protein, partial [Bacteroidales bacterium]|nr:RagB/SusD family nutrient uptake outer membrane protein [Bacteroidales bacterium]